jgi:hypothetical protein
MLFGLILLALNLEHLLERLLVAVTLFASFFFLTLFFFLSNYGRDSKIFEISLDCFAFRSVCV